MPDYDHIFNHEPAKYDRLVMAEDYQGKLAKAVLDVMEVDSTATVADLGSGTGRVAFLVAPHVRQVYGVEPVAAMREFAQNKAAKDGIRNVHFLSGEHKRLPLADESVDAIVEGWAFLRAYRTSFPEWRAEFQSIWDEARRVLRPGGTIAVIETMGTFDLWNSVPEAISPLYDHFETEMKLSKVLVRTDYRFQDLQEAVDLGGFFFGEEIGAAIGTKGSPIVPELTAVWHGRLR